MARPRTVLVTRPEPDAAAFAERVAALGHRPLLAPLLTIRFLDGVTIDLADVSALAFTSANGVRALVHAVPDAPSRGIGVFAVGDATARVARETGFTPVTAARGDVDSLVRTIATALDGRSGTVLHVAGRERAGDLVRLLEREGIAARRAVLYAAEPAADLPGDVHDALAHGLIDDVVIFSPRTARQFVTLIGKAGLSHAAARLRLVALSRNVAEAASGLAFAEVAVAPRRDRAALLELLAPGSTQASMSDSDKSTDKNSAKNKKKKKNKSANASSSDAPGAAAPENEHGQAPAPDGEPAPGGEEPATPATHVRRVSSGGAALIVAVVLIVAGGVALGLPAVRSRVAGWIAPQTGATADALARRVSGLEQDVAGLSAKLSRPVEDPRVSALVDKVNGLADRVAKLETGGVAPARIARIEQRLDALSAKLDTLEARIGQLAQPRPDAVAGRVSLLAFVSALASGRPFAPFVDTARERIKDLGDNGAALGRDLDALAPAAARGVPTMPALAARAGAIRLVPEPAGTGAAAAPQGENASKGLWARIKAKIAGLVTIRRVDNGGTEQAPAAQSDLAPVRAALAAGDLGAAAAAVEGIDTARLSQGSRAALDALRRDIGLRRTAERLARSLDTAIAAPAAAAPPSAP